MVIPGNVILILSHKSACQEPKQPEHRSSARRRRPPAGHRAASTSARWAFYLASWRPSPQPEDSAATTRACAALAHGMKNATSSCPYVVRRFHLGGPGFSEQGRGVPRWKVPLSLSRSYGEGVCMWPCVDPQGAGTGGEQTRDRGSPENSRWRSESRGAHCGSPQAARGRGECPTVCTVFRKPQLSTK